MQLAEESMALTASWSRRAATLILWLVTATVTYADDVVPTPQDADGTPTTARTTATDTTTCQPRRGSDCSDTFCEGDSDYLRFQDCDRGTCACLYPLAADDFCYSSPCWPTDCKLCSTTANYASMSDLIPLALTIGVCFVVAVTAMLACKMLIKRMYSGGPVARFGDGDADSVSSMQRWINERLRDRPPRYEEMVSETAPTPATRSSRSARTASTPDATPPTISAAVAEAEEKPPAYEVAVNDGIYYQGPVADNIPPPVYSAEAVEALATDGRRCYRNPCFLGDVEDPPPYSQSPQRSTRSVSLPDPFVESLFDPFEPPPESAGPHCRASDSPFAASSPSASTATLATASTPPSSPTTSLASFASASSSSFPPTPGEPATAGLDLLTVSQAVALKEMMLAEGVPAAAATRSVESAVHWTSTC